MKWLIPYILFRFIQWSTCFNPSLLQVLGRMVELGVIARHGDNSLFPQDASWEFSVQCLARVFIFQQSQFIDLVEVCQHFFQILQPTGRLFSYHFYTLKCLPLADSQFIGNEYFHTRFYQVYGYGYWEYYWLAIIFGYGYLFKVFRWVNLFIVVCEPW